MEPVSVWATPEVGEVWQADSADLMSLLGAGAAQLAYLDPPFFTQRTQSGPSGSYRDVWVDQATFLYFIEHTARTVRNVLTDTGVIVIHVDQRTSHRVRCILDDTFGPDRFINEIVWCYSSGGASPTRFARKHDTLMAYSKTSDYRWNALREPYPQNYGNRPGFHPDGRVMNDWWQIPILSTTAKERTGYPNQKPVELVARLIRAFTDPGDLVLDCFCGSGTTAAAAIEEGRRFWVADRNPEAITSTLTRIDARLIDQTGTVPA